LLGMRNRQTLAREPYSDRDETLRLLGFSGYTQYCRSRLWEIVRQRALDIHGAKCKKCGEPATQVHHAVYSREVLTGEDVRGLTPVCGGCHRAGSLPGRGTRDRKIDRIRVKHLHETNIFLAKASPRPHRGGYWCECGQRRKRSHLKCRACERKLRPCG
jgi:hypothetical protein